MAKMRLNFGIGFLIVLMTSVAGFFTGYRYGGYAKDYEEAQIKVSPRFYDVSELVDRKSKMSVTTQVLGLINLIKVVVSPQHAKEWEDRDERSASYERSQKILFTTDGRTHDRIKWFLQHLATEMEKAKAKKSMAVVAQ
jgi:hypothetical protein